jgi:hypothetical protein
MHHIHAYTHTDVSIPVLSKEKNRDTLEFLQKRRLQGWKGHNRERSQVLLQKENRKEERETQVWKGTLMVGKEILFSSF